MTAEAYKAKTAHDLCGEIDRFISDNAHSRDVDDRWLCHFLAVDVLPTVREVRNNRLEPATRNKVNTFRAEEIEAELETKRRELQVLERDLKTINERKTA